MSTRTTGKRETVSERCEARIQASWKRKGMKVSVSPYFAALPVSHVRAELERMARQVRRLYQTQGQFYGDNICVKLNDVLDLIKQAKQ